MPSLAPSSHWEFSMSILKLDVMRAPEMASIFGTWGLHIKKRYKVYKIFKLKRLDSFSLRYFPVGRKRSLSALLVVFKCTFCSSSLTYPNLHWFEVLRKVLRASFPLCYGHFKPINNHYLKIDRNDILVSRLSTHCASKLCLFWPNLLLIIWLFKTKSKKKSLIKSTESTITVLKCNYYLVCYLLLMQAALLSVSLN